MGKKRNVNKKGGVGIDFMRAKHKVGKKIPQAENATKTSYKTKGIVLPEQSIAADRDGALLSQRKHTLTELLGQSSHYNSKVRKDALNGLRELLTQHPSELAKNTVMIIDTLAPRVADVDRGVREALKNLLKTSLLSQMPPDQLAPFVPILLVHTCSAMTHLTPDIRSSSMAFLDLIVDSCPSAIGVGFSRQIVAHFVTLLSPSGSNSRPPGTLSPILSSLMRFLTAVCGPPGSGPGSQKDEEPVQEYHWGRPDSRGAMSAPMHTYRANTAATSAVTMPDHMFQSGSGSQGAESVTPGDLPEETGPRFITVLCHLLVPRLLEAMGGCTLTLTPAPDPPSLSCTLLSLRLLVFLLRKVQAPGETGVGSRPSVWGDTPGSGQGDLAECGAHVRSTFGALILRRVQPWFPLSAPAVRQVRKVEEDLAAINCATCQLMIALLGGQVGTQVEDSWQKAAFDFYEGALQGTVVPTESLSASMTDRQLAEPHWRDLVACLPDLLPRASPSRQLSLLSSFSELYSRSKAHSKLKQSCLAAMESIMAGGPTLGPGFGPITVPESTLGQWMHSLPRLLWDLKAAHPDLSKSVLRMLLHVARSSGAKSSLARIFSDLQAPLVAFFCTTVPARDKSMAGRVVFGPFVGLPDSCQVLALDLMSHQVHFSRPLLQSWLACCQHSGVSADVATRVVEIVHRGYSCRKVEADLFLSFVLSLLMGTRGGGDKLDSSEEEQRRQEVKMRAMAASVCSALSHAGDGGLLLTLLAPSLSSHLESEPKVSTVENIVQLVAVCLQRTASWLPPKQSSLPTRLEAALPLCLTLLLTRHLSAGNSRAGAMDRCSKAPIHSAFGILLASSTLLAPTFECITGRTLSPDSSEDDRMAALRAMQFIFSFQPLQKPLLKIEAVVCDCLMRIKAQQQSGSHCTARQFLKVYSVAAMVFGWGEEEKKIEIRT